MQARAFAAFTLLGFFVASPLLAQDASLTGRVADSSGGVVPGATVVLTNTGTGVDDGDGDQRRRPVSLFRRRFRASTASPSRWPASRLRGSNDVRLEVGQSRDVQRRVEAGRSCRKP